MSELSKPNTAIAIDPNGLMATTLATLTALLGLLPLAILPLFVGVIIDDLGLSTKMAGALTATNLLGNAVGVLIVSFITRMTMKHVVYVGLVIAVIFELTSFGLTNIPDLFCYRFLAGVGGGLVTGAAYSWIARQAKPDRGFALLILLQFLFGSILFYFLPDITLQYGVTTFYGLFILFALVALACCFILDLHPQPLATTAQKAQLKEVKNTLLDKKIIGKVLISIALFELAASGIWAFIERMGADWQLSFDQIGLSLSIGSLAGIPGFALVIIFCLKWGRSVPLILGFTCVIASLLLFIFGPENLWFYTLGLIIFNAAWSYVIPYIQGIQAQVDDTGRVAVWGMFMVLSAIAAGPFVFGLFINEQGYYSAMILACLLFLSSLCFIFKVAKTLDKQPLNESSASIKF